MMTNSKCSIIDDLVYRDKIVDRRSKGKLSIVFKKSTQSNMILRRLKLDICNAGYDDGLSTSTLREITNSKKLDSEYVSKVVE